MSIIILRLTSFFVVFMVENSVKSYAELEPFGKRGFKQPGFEKIMRNSNSECYAFAVMDMNSNNLGSFVTERNKKLKGMDKHD